MPLDELLPGQSKYLVTTVVYGTKSKRRFFSVYEGYNPEEFLGTQKIRLSEIFACNIEATLKDESSKNKNNLGH